MFEDLDKFIETEYLRITEKEQSLLFTLAKLHSKHFQICDASRDLVPFVQFKKREKHP